MLLELAAAIGTLVASEPVMTLVHRFLFHGPLWCSHQSHHEHPTARRLVRNDLLWLGPLLASALLVAFGGPLRVGVGLGIVAYVSAYVVAHDGVAHGRFPVPGAFRRNELLRHVAATHRLHHRGGRTGTGAPPFGVFAAAWEHRWRLSAGYAPSTRSCTPASA